MGSVTLSDGPASKRELAGLVLKREALLQSGYPLPPDQGRGTPRVRVSDRSPRAVAFPSPCHAAGNADACTVWNEAYIMLVSCIDYALDMTCI